MNLIEARKLAHEGWVRSPTITGEEWMRIRGEFWFIETGTSVMNVTGHHIDAEDWEPKPAPPKPFETLLWVHDDGTYTTNAPRNEAEWRKIRVREVEE